VQRKALSGFIPRKVGELQGTQGPGGDELPAKAVTATEELDPPGTPSRAPFEGFSEELQASTAARRGSNMAVVARDTDERYHALLTDAPSLPPDAEGSFVPTNLDGLTFVSVARLRTPVGADRWKSILDTAMSAYARWTMTRNRFDKGLAELCFQLLVIDAMGVPPDKVRGSTDQEWRTGVINIDLRLQGDAGGKAGSTEPLRTTGAPSDPRPTVGVGPSVFATPDNVESTITHELTHAEHTRLAVRWLKRWRASQSKGSAASVVPFHSWLAKQKVDDAVKFLVLEQLAPEEGDSRELSTLKAGSSNTELLSYLAGFKATYERTDVGPDASHPDLEHFLHHLDEYWGGASDDVRSRVVDELGAFLGRVDAAHRERFRTAVQNRRSDARNHETKYSKLWPSLARF
jgi:hypothetical protein